MADYTNGIQGYFDREIDTIRKLNIGEINEAMNALLDARNRGAVIWVMGNGGSAATASHFVCDFSKGLSEVLKGRKFDLRCLSDNTPIVMAIANDISFEDVFLFQMEGLVKPGDLVIAISGSGNSMNVVKAVEYARQQGAKAICLTGYSGGKLKALADYTLHVPLNDMQIVEDIHMMFDHMMMKVMGESK